MSAALFIVALSLFGGAVIYAMSLERRRDEQPSETIRPTTLTDMREHAKPVRANATCCPVWPPRGPQP